MYHSTDEQFYTWLAGFIDGDGCFSIHPNYRHSKLLTIGFSIYVAQKYTTSEALYYIKNRLGVGKVYVSNKGTPNEKHSWQTVSIYEAIRVVDAVLPYLVVKKAKTKRFSELAKEYAVPPVRGKRPRGSKLRTREEMRKYVEAAVDLNYDRQSVQYRNLRGKDYWFSVVDKLYGA